MKRIHFFLIPLIMASGMILHSCSFPVQYVGFDNQPQEEIQPEDLPVEGQPPEPGIMEEPLVEENRPEEGLEPDDIFFTADRMTIAPGGCTGLEWNAGRFESVFLNGEPVEREGRREVCPPGTTAYVLKVETGAGMTIREVMISVEGGEPEQEMVPEEPGPEPQSSQQQSSQGQSASGCPGAPVFFSFSASPATITSGQTSTLTWGKVTNGSSSILVKSVILEPGFGEVGSPGTKTVKPSKTTTYTLKATGCGGSASRSLTVTVGSGSSGGQSSIDLAITDLYSKSLPKGDVMVRITNHGPNNAVNVKAVLKCTVDKTAYQGGAKTNVSKAYPVSLTLNLNAGQTVVAPTNILIDTSNHWYQFICQINGTGISDPNSANNTYSEKFPPPP